MTPKKRLDNFVNHLKHTEGHHMMNSIYSESSAKESKIFMGNNEAMLPMP